MPYWYYVVSTATHVINRLPTPNLSHKYPWETLFHTPPHLTHLIGCQCFPLLTSYTAHKLHPKTTSCVFLGYPNNSKGYLCFDPIAHKLYALDMSCSMKVYSQVLNTHQILQIHKSLQSFLLIYTHFLTSMLSHFFVL